VSDLVVSFVIVVVLLAVVLAGLVAITVVPAVLTVQLAERRGFDLFRWGCVGTSFALVGTALAVLAGAGKTSAPAWSAVIPLALTWAGPFLVSQVARGDEALGGRPGAHL
jgi:hypothetical protein